MVVSNHLDIDSPMFRSDSSWSYDLRNSDFPQIHFFFQTRLRWFQLATAFLGVKPLTFFLHILGAYYICYNIYYWIMRNTHMSHLQHYITVLRKCRTVSEGSIKVGSRSTRNLIGWPMEVQPATATVESVACKNNSCLSGLINIGWNWFLRGKKCNIL